MFIHPFGDGNGRIHRFLIHHLLARRGFTPHGLLFPVSAVMLRDRRHYDRVLAAYASSIEPFVQYSLDAQGRMDVHNSTAHLIPALGCDALFRVPGRLRRAGHPSRSR